MNDYNYMFNGNPSEQFRGRLLQIYCSWCGKTISFLIPTISRSSVFFKQCECGNKIIVQPNNQGG